VTTAGRFLAPPGRYFPGLAKDVNDVDLPEAALHELAHSGDWVKLIGDSPLPGPGLSRTFSEEAVVETVRRVHEAGGRVAMHCGLPEVIQTAIDAGVDSLEHATFLQRDQVPAMVAAGTVWVPTLSILEAIRSMLAPAEMAALADIPEVVAAAADAGVPVLAGTDAGMGPHGMIRHEIGLLTEYGLSPEAAIGAASWEARALLRLPGIESGAAADLVGYRTDPRRHLAALASPQLLVLDGKVLRS
jgi:imidazolonepropionase-like amidohydrolase